MIAQDFGGDWTQTKLRMLRGYLEAYAKIMHGKRFRFAYIDAFAGTGYLSAPSTAEADECSLFPEIAAQEGTQFRKGSARIALEVSPEFDKYIPIERDAAKCEELGRLRTEFPALSARIQVVQADCNSYLLDLCTNYNWGHNRAVLFLDPFGMQVSWSTVKAAASTHAIDLWYLFPIGMGVNRLLQRDHRISEAFARRLDDVFGTHEWETAFYTETAEPGLFGDESAITKDASFARIADFVLQRLKSVFPGVAENPLVLRNSKKSPLFLLCFAAANKAGAPLALKIAQHILGT